MFAEFPDVKLRRTGDPRGDTGGFLITTYDSSETAHAVCRALRGEGITSPRPECSTLVLSEYGLHIYSNIFGLVKKLSIDGRGTPWTLQENSGSNVEYTKTTCPIADILFDRSVLVVIPSCLTEDDEADIIEGFRRAIEVSGGTI